ncbi:MAG: VCBS repeat-containing protein [Acidobacteriota bacterium]
MRKIAFLGIFAAAAAVVVMLSGGTASAQNTPLFVDDFTYASGTQLTANGWSAHSAGGVTPGTVTASGLTYPGYASSGVGNAASLGTSGEDVNRTFATQTTGSVYMAAMINVTSSQITGDYFLHLVDGPIANNAFKGRLFVKKDAATTNYAIGIQKSSTVNTQYSGFTFTPGTTYLVVIKYTFVAGATNDTVTLFINPTLGGAEPAPTLTATLGTDADATDIRGVALRQGSAANAAAVTVDGIRIGSTWASVAASPVRHTNADFDGDGKTDYTVVRPSGAGRPGMLGGMVKGSHQAKAKFLRENPNVLNSPAATPLIWYTFGSAAGAVSISQWGDGDTDDFVPADFDGDGKTDIAIWRPGAPFVAAFYIINSSDNTVRVQQYSETGYDPSVTADYDGDGKADPAVYGCTVPGQPSVCEFTFLGSLNNPTNAVTYIPWGFGQDNDFFPYVGDFDGDGKADFCIQRTQPGSPGVSQFALLHNDGIFFTSEFITWGNDSDFIIPGDYDGDGKTDFMVERLTPQGYIYFLLTRANTVQITGWGAANDQIVQGDYDGDGKTDIAVWRPAQAPNSGVFYVLTQTNAVQIAGWGTCTGLLCDVPVAGWQIH